VAPQARRMRTLTLRDTCPHGAVKINIMNRLIHFVRGVEDGPRSQTKSLMLTDQEAASLSDRFTFADEAPKEPAPEPEPVSGRSRRGKAPVIPAENEE